MSDRRATRRYAVVIRLPSGMLVQYAIRAETCGLAADKASRMVHGGEYQLRTEGLGVTVMETGERLRVFREGSRLAYKEDEE